MTEPQSDSLVQELRSLDRPAPWDARRFRRLASLTQDRVGGLRKSERLLLLETLAYDLGFALGEPEITNSELAETLARLPSLLDASTFDVTRSAFATYMFWDLVLFARGAVLGEQRGRSELQPLFIRVLLRQRFSRNRVLRRSAEHGLFHLLQACGENVEGLVHP